MQTGNPRDLLTPLPMAAALLPFALGLAACRGTPRAGPERSAGHQRSLPDILGSTHARGVYHLSEKDFLNEGADQLLNMGARVIKLWFYNGAETPDNMYPYHSEWPKVDSLVEGARLPYWTGVFRKPFTTYILNVMALGMPDYYWLDGITQEQVREEERQFYELTRHFLAEYKGTGKTFVLAHHEGDWHLKGTTDPDYETPSHIFGNAAKWLQARQNGVDTARSEIGMDGVRVFHAAEVVNVVRSMKAAQDNMVNRVLPYVKLDLVSYSCWDSTVIGGIHDPAEITEALDYIASHAVDSDYFGTRNVYIGEYGLPGNEYSDRQVMQVVRNVVQRGLEWGCPYIVYWQVYCNEAKSGVAPPISSNDACRGFWLIRPDGSSNEVYGYFSRLCRGG